MKAMTLRLPDELFARVELAARSLDISNSEFIRRALRAYLDALEKHPDFQHRVAEQQERDKTVYERLKQASEE